MTSAEAPDPLRRVRATTIAARQPLETVIEQARVVESLGYGGLWIPEAMGRDALMLCALLGRSTETIGLATGIVPLPRRTPMQLAMAAATAAEAASGRLTVGVGIGHASTLGAGWAGPLEPATLADVERGLPLVRALLAGAQPQPPVRLRGVHHREASPLMLAALSPRLARLAGRVADGLVLNWLTADRCAALVAAFRDEAERAGRDAAALTVAAYVPVCVTDDVEGAYGALARQVAAYGALPAYARSLARCGLADGVAEIVAGDAGASGAGRRALEALAAIGAPGDVADRLDAFHAAGVDVVVLAPVPVAGGDAWASMVTTWTALAPGDSV